MVALAGLQCDLGLAIAVEIIDNHRRVPGAQLNRPAEVHSPEKRSVSFIALDLECVGAFLHPARVHASAGPLDNKIILAVAVQISDTHFVNPAAGDVIPQLERDILLHRRLSRKLRPWGSGLLDTLHNRRNPPGIVTVQRCIGIDEVGCLLN